MLEYIVSSPSPTSHFLHITLQVSPPTPTVRLQLAAWRPGRYQLQKYAKNIYSFDVQDEKGKPLSYEKRNPYCWEIAAADSEKLIVRYTYLAATIDGGGSWVDETQWYINWINCLFYVVGCQDIPFTIHLEIPDDWKIATSLAREGKTLKPTCYEEAAESPTICSPTLQINTYTIHSYRFHIAIQGNIVVNWEEIIPLFEAFTQKQIELFGTFPCEEYYFLYQILPISFYHGVEHTHSTIIVLGSDNEFYTPEKFKEFLGISSHELFHTWNVKRIRPTEMQPYDYTQPCYFPTGFIVEGFTTYYGDLMLLRAGIFSWEEYANELNTILIRHLKNLGNLSLKDASIDLWVDGYETNNPPRKPSIYVKGCLVALLLDLEIRIATNQQASLDDVMRKLWADYQHEKPYKGYTLESFIELVASFIGKEKTISWYKECIEGNTNLLERLSNALYPLGIGLIGLSSLQHFQQRFGFSVSVEEDKYIVREIVPNSMASTVLALGDQLLTIQGKTIQEIICLPFRLKEIQLSLLRENELKNVCFYDENYTYFSTFIVEMFEEKSPVQEANFLNWAFLQTKKDF